MKVTSALVDFPSAQNRASEICQQLTEQVLSTSNRSTLFVVTVFEGRKRTPQASRTEYFHRYDRLELDVDCRRDFFNAEDSLAFLLRAALRHALVFVGEQELAFTVPSPIAELEVQRSKPAIKSRGVLVVSIFASNAGVPLAQALGAIEMWVDALPHTFIDGETDITPSEVTIYLGTERSIRGLLERFLRDNFSRNGVLAIDVDETVIAEWQ